LLQQYIDASHAKTLTIVPVYASHPVADDDDTAQQRRGARSLGALISEQFTRPHAVPIQNLATLADTAASALGNALAFEQIPYAHAWLHWRAALPQSRRRWVSAISVAAVASVLVLLLYPAKLFISVSGELQPRDRRHVYALADGVIESIDVKHGQNVRQGELLAVMRNPELEAQIESLATELHAAEAEWEGVKSALIDPRNDRNETVRDEHQLIARKKSLEHEVTTLKKQLEILQAQHSRLQLMSPIEGQITTWDLHQRLANRPVRHGETLLTVADPDAAWILELHVPDRRIGHVIKASQVKGALPVRFIVTADPTHVHRAEVVELAVAAEYDRLHETTVRVTANVADGTEFRKLPGGEVKAKLDCGRHPLGFVWFHGLIDWLRTSLLL
jgi:multidrug efflux pump subunit AcrA (membrane-fusion protein)